MNSSECYIQRSSPVQAKWTFLCYSSTGVSKPLVLALHRPRQLCEFALVVDHLQVLDIVADVAGAPQRESVVRVWVRRHDRFPLSIICILSLKHQKSYHRCSLHVDMRVAGPSRNMRSARPL